MFDGIEAYPLCWPVGWQRTKPGLRKKSNFSEDHTIAVVRDCALNELRLLGAKTPIISTNMPLRKDGQLKSVRLSVDDPGVAVYFALCGKPCVLACDKWTLVQDNLWAIVKHVGAQRGQQRWGVGTLEQAFSGFVALPPAVKSTWWEVLGVAADADLETIKAAYLRKAKETHPDVGGSDESFIQVQAAWEEANKNWRP